VVELMVSFRQFVVPVRRRLGDPPFGGKSMTQKTGNGSGSAHKNHQGSAHKDHAGSAHKNHQPASSHRSANGTHHHEWFSRFAHETARLSGKPIAFITAVAVVVIWAVTGPLFHYSDTWQLVINTSTTIITFLMVFLIQNTQNRDTMALQVKLSELIIAVQGAHNQLAAAEDLSEEELERLHKHYCGRADATLESLEHRRAHRHKK
jgi:low affinity Fe/Cu permease